MPKPSFTLPKFNPKADLPYLAAAAQTAQYALAGSVLLGSKGWFFGGVMGALVSMSVAYASSQYDDIAKGRKPYVFWGMILVGVLSPVVIGSSMFLDLPTAFHPVWRGVLGAVWGILPDASVALVGFVAGKGLAKQDERPKQTPAEVAQPAEKPAKAPKAGAKVEPAVAQVLALEPQPAPVVAQAAPSVVQPEPLAFSDENLIAQYILKPTVTNVVLAQVFGVSPQAVSARRLALEQQGRIRRVGKEIKIAPEFVEVKG